MSRPRRPALLLFAFTAALACSDSDTVLVINVASAPDVTNVSRINVRAERPNGSPFTTSFDVPPLDAGPVAPFFQRVTLNGWEAHVRVTGEALAPNAAPVASAAVEVDIKAGEAVVAFLTLRQPDAGTSAGADGGDAAGPDATGIETGATPDAPSPGSDAAHDTNDAGAPPNAVDASVDGDATIDLDEDAG
jgi:hypothetical protein